VANAVQANLLAATADAQAVSGEVFNVGAGARTTLIQLFDAMRAAVAALRPDVPCPAPVYDPFRAGDVRESQADIGKARRRLGYEPTHTLAQGLADTLAWYAARAE
jgi:UDP-N-acetylglucosamine 4-epimerase